MCLSISDELKGSKNSKTQVKKIKQTQVWSHAYYHFTVPVCTWETTGIGKKLGLCRAALYLYLGVYLMWTVKTLCCTFLVKHQSVDVHFCCSQLRTLPVVVSPCENAYYYHNYVQKGKVLETSYGMKKTELATTTRQQLMDSNSVDSTTLSCHTAILSLEFFFNRI